jgi:hypothetical protein
VSGNLDETGGDWNRQPPESQPVQTKGRKATESSTPRLLALAAVTLGALAYAFGGDLFNDQPKRRPPVAAARPKPAAAPADAPVGEESSTQATLANRPAQPQEAAEPAAAADSVPVDSDAEEPAGDEGASPASVEEPSIEPEEPAPPPEPPTTAKKRGRKGKGNDAESEKLAAAEAAASPESRQAARAARHVVAGRYAEALPLYEALTQRYPQTTAYAATVRLLRLKLGMAPAATAAGGTP